mgnify:CR=1 FL=1
MGNIEKKLRGAFLGNKENFRHVSDFAVILMHVKCCLPLVLNVFMELLFVSQVCMLLLIQNRQTPILSQKQIARIVRSSSALNL